MLERQPDKVRLLLLRTSLLERVNAELAGLLTGDEDAERVLQDLEEAGAFVVSLDAARTWFRYHQMFAGLLRLELRRAEPGAVADRAPPVPADCLVPEAERCICFPGDTAAFLADPDALTGSTPIVMQGMIESKWLNRLGPDLSWKPASLATTCWCRPRVLAADAQKAGR